ncbi:MAG TPA: DUF502 domain-containing protein [Pseudolabrys sp.]|jgi:uncharacterized membrane protein|nr:DUF502 domain-containing protein [Pseudolabrys sp.]
MSDFEPKPGEELAGLAKNPATPSQTGIMGRVRNWFLTGLVVAGPLAVTVWLIWSFVNWVDNAVQPLIPPLYRPESYLPWPIPGTGLVIAVVVLTLLGFLTANLVGRTLVGWGESLLSRMPIVRPIYKTMKQIFETLFSKNGSSFRKVALVEFPAPGMWSLVFISQPPSGEIASKLPAAESDYVSVFLACTPNPTTGFFFFVQRKDLIELDLSVENAMALLISAGMVQPDDSQKKLAAIASTARAAQLAKKDEALL